MHCEKCGYALPHGAAFCPGCGVKLGVTTKTVDATEQAGQATVDLTKKAVHAAKPVAKDVVRLTGKAIAKVGSLTERAGKKLKEAAK